MGQELNGSCVTLSDPFPALLDDIDGGEINIAADHQMFVTMTG